MSVQLIACGTWPRIVRLLRIDSRPSEPMPAHLHDRRSLSRLACLRSRYRGNGQVYAFHIHAGHSQKGRATVLKLHVPPSLASSSCVTTPQKTGPAIKLPEVRTAQRTTSSKCSEAGAPKSVEAGKLPPDVTNERSSASENDGDDARCLRRCCSVRCMPAPNRGLRLTNGRVSHM